MEESSSQTQVLDNCPGCNRSVEVSALPPFSEIKCPHCGAQVRMRTTMGQYHITGVLGEGGMSQVFKAVDVHLQREVALKILHQSLSRDSSLTAMFEREAKLTASILHPNVVKVYTVGRDQGYFFIAMEIIDAVSLEQMIADKGCLSEKEILHIAHNVTSGLKAAYDEGLIHRDIKPGNMLVMEDGTAKLVDFGLAVHQDGQDESEELWATPFYVPPEKLDGDPDTHLGDIYSLGATLFHAVAGKPPFEANTPSMDELKEIKRQSLNLKGEAPSLSKPTLKLIEKMMAYRPEDRIESYEAILERIEEIESRQFGAAPRARGAKKKSALSGPVIGALAVIALAVIGLASVFSKKEESEEGEIGISAEERVISAGDNTNTGKFLEGRALIVQGEFRKAEPIFDGLVEETGMAPATRMWSLYFQGMSRLFLGKVDESLDSFAYIAAVPNVEGPEAEAIRDFMGLAATTFSSPLPLVDGTQVFEGESLAGLGLLTAAVKNWQHGQFESSMRLFDAFLETNPPVEFEWMKGLKATVEPFRNDWEILKKLPNPSRKAGEGSIENREVLAAALGALQTRGGAEKTVKSRLARIDLIAQVEKEEKEAALIATLPSQVSPAVGEPVIENMPAKSDRSTLDPVEEADRDKLKGVLSGLTEFQSSLRFADAIPLLENTTMMSERGKRWQEELVAGLGKADAFVPMLVSGFVSRGYSGLIRRRAGVPLDAEITGAGSTYLIVDLGFGPNEVPLTEFAPDWMREAAESLLEPPGPANVAEWENVIFFSLATGQFSDSVRLGELVARADDDFRARWRILSAFKLE